MMSVELPLSTKIFLVLNPSIMSMITKGLSRGCFTPHASSFKKTIPGLSLRPFVGAWTNSLHGCYSPVSVVLSLET